jgi:hypothetical protein
VFLIHNGYVRRMTALLIVAAFMAGALLLYWPALSLALMGDDYQWVQHAHRAMHSPSLLFADLDTFYRPASTWTLALDRVAWGFRPAGFHLTNVLLQGLAAAALALAARRLGLPLAAALSAGALWLATPFTSEPAIAVAIRFENLLLLAWLALIVAWPRPDEAWSRARTAAIAGATALAAASKETWVVTFIVVLALELGVRRSRPGVATRRSLPFVAGAALYAAVYFLAFPSDKGYFVMSPAPLAKVPHMLAAFLFLEPLTPADFPLSWRGALAFALAVGAAAWAVRRRDPAGLTGAALAFAPLLPTLLVPYLPGRYTAIPYAGVALLLLATIVAATRLAAPAVRVSALAAATAAGVLAVGAGVVGVGSELADAAQVSAAHVRLLAEAAAVAPQLPLDRPAAVVRAERDNPLQEIAGALQGLQKLYFVRPPDPYGLIDAAALFEWAIAREDVLLRRYDDGDTRFAGARGAVLLHESGRFTWVDRAAADLAQEARQWRARGMPVRFIARTALR